MEDNQIVVKALRDQINNLMEKVVKLENKVVVKSDYMIFVKTSNQEEKNKINIFVDKTDTIGNIKNQLVNRLNTTEKKNLFFEGKLLEDNLTCEQCNIKEEAILFFAKDFDEYLNIWSDYEERNFVEKKNVPKIKLERILVRTFERKTIPVFVEQSDTIKNIKLQIKDKLNIPLEKQFLYLKETLLEDNLTCNQYNINKNTTLYLSKDQMYLYQLEGHEDFLKFMDYNEKKFMIDSLKKANKKFRAFLYSATRDGDTADIFHQKCDNQGPLLYLIQTTQNAKFGIYTSRPITSEGTSKTDSNQMVISPSNNFAIFSDNKNATYHCYSGKGAHFHCMQLNTPFLSTDCCDIQSCSDFTLPCYPSGNSSYRIKELEVYSLEEM